MKLIKIFFLLVGLDQLTKWLVHQNLPHSLLFSSYPYGGIGLLQLPYLEISINHLTNRGAAWGIGEHFPVVLLWMRIFLVSGFVWYLHKLSSEKGPWPVWLGFLLLTSGALSNILDFFLYGHVIDMIHVMVGLYDFPTFNIADAIIFLGIILLLFCTHSSSHTSSASGI